jgi:hypothetical protein
MGVLTPWLFSYVLGIALGQIADNRKKRRRRSGFHKVFIFEGKVIVQLCYNNR